MTAPFRAALLLGLAGCGPGQPIDGITPVGSASTPTGPTLCDQGLEGAVCLSEVQSANQSTRQLQPGVFPDWIELWNPGTEPIDRERISVRAGKSDRAPLTGPALQPGDRLLQWADDEDAADHLPFRIDAAGETLEIWVDDRLSDRIEVPELLPDTAFGRYGGVLTTSCTPSPGAPNGAATPCTDPRELVFALGTIHELHLAIDAANLALLETSETFFHPIGQGALAFEGGEFPLIEVKLKGGYGSFRGDIDTQKVGFKLDLDSHEDHAWRGLQKLTLNNMVQDPTFTHEWLSFELFRAVGIPAPRVGYARVHLNGEYLGFYALVESVDGPFLDDWYGNNDGHLFESAYGPDFDAGKQWEYEYDAGPSEAEGRARIAEVIAFLDENPVDEATYLGLRQRVDMDQWMLNMAVEHATWHWDGYWTENNHRMYLDPETDRWTILPHGADQTWVDGWPEPYTASSQPRLYDFCLAVPSCRAMYADQLRRVADAMDGLALEPTLDALIALTEPEFDADPRKEEADQRPGQLDSTRVRIQTVAEALRAVAE